MTRKIEQQMLAAIREGRSWQSGNTSVTFHASEHNAGLCSVFLHGNRIAIWDRCYGTATAVNDTFRRWPTSTTRSRLRALGIDASIKRGVAMIGGKPV